MEDLQLFDERELASNIGLSYWTVRDMRIKYGLPYVKLGSRFYYDFKDVKKWIEDHTKSNLDGKMEPIEMSTMSCKFPSTQN